MYSNKTVTLRLWRAKPGTESYHYSVLEQTFPKYENDAKLGKVNNAVIKFKMELVLLTSSVI